MSRKCEIDFNLSVHLKKNTRPRKSLSLVLAQKKQFISDWISYFFFCTNISFHGSSTDPIFLDDPILWKYQDGYKTIFDNHWFWRKGHSSWRRFRPSNMENCSPWVCILGESRFKITVVEILFQKKIDSQKLHFSKIWNPKKYFMDNFTFYWNKV